jgi:hypothetical protein
MTKQMKRDYKTYQAKCRQAGVEPTPADFLGIELTWEELDDNRQGNWRYLLSRQPKALAATA